MADDPNTTPAGEPPSDAPTKTGTGVNNPASAAGAASCLTGLALLVLVVGTLLYVWLWDQSLVPAGMSWGFGRIALLLLLIVVIPIVVFRAVTLWIMGEGPRFADIEFSWRAGVEALAEQGISLKSTPLFIIVGAGSEKLRKNIMAASGINFRVNGFPDVPSPLHWYASDDAIYLYLEDVSWTHLAGKLYRKATRGVKSRNAGAGPLAARPTDQPSAPTPPSATPGSPGYGSLAGGGSQPMISTIAPGQAPPPAAGPAAASAEPLDASVQLPAYGQSAPASPYMGTLSPGAAAAESPAPQGPAPRPAPATQRRTPAPNPGQQRQVMSKESSLQLRRLEAVCSKLRRFREPVCAANGMLILLPFDLLQAGRSDIEEVERAIAADLATAQNELEVRCPVSALVVAMEQERGFCELIRRIGSQQAAQQRFGQRFDLRRRPTVEELQRFNSYVCGVFEDWVYTLFREDTVLSHPGNPALYNLLCKVRRSFQARLSDVLSKGFGCDPNADEPMLFSGCYFAATGSQPERQAFVSGVLKKLRDEQEELSWSRRAIDSSARRRVLVRFGWSVAAVLVVVLAWLLSTGQT